MPSTNLDQQAIQDFISFDQNTHRQVVSASVGKVLLRLNSLYFPNSEITDEVYQQDLTEISKFAKDEETEASIKFIDKQALQPTDQFDSFTIYDENSISTDYVVTLKQTLVLVWRAINDNQAYQHHLKDNSPETIENERQHRIDNFLQNLIRIKNDPICHHGIRNETVFILNHTYKDVEIIEDVKLTIYNFLKQELFNAFYKNKHVNAQTLKLALLIWMQENNPSPLMEHLDPNLENALYEKLRSLFKRHGSNPDAPEIEKTITEAFTQLEFYVDSQNYPVLEMINSLMKASSKNERADEALEYMQEWIKEHYSFNDVESDRQIANFYLMYTIHRQIRDNFNLLNLTGNLTEEVSLLEEDIALYFQLVENKKRVELTSETMQRVQAITKLIARVKKDNLAPQIENFFSLWFSDNPDDQCSLYTTLLLNRDAIKKIHLNAQNVEEFQTKALSDDNIKDITPYEINRIFLHAIIIDPEHWTPEFFQKVFVPTLEFVIKQFNQNNNELALAVKHTSYPDILLAQLVYLENRYRLHANESETIEVVPRPTPMILLPEQIKTAQEWVNLSAYLSAKQESWEKIYSAFQVVYESRLNDAIDRNDYAYSLELCRSVPPRFRERFVKKVGSKDADKGLFVLRLILECTPDFSNFLALLSNLTPQDISLLPEVLVIQNEHGFTGLHHIIFNAPNYLAEVITLMEQSTHGVEKLLEALFLPDQDNWTGLHSILRNASFCLPQILKIIEQSPGGVDKLAKYFSLQDKDGRTDLHMIARYAPQYLPQLLNTLTYAKQGLEMFARAVLLQSNSMRTGLLMLVIHAPNFVPTALNMIEKATNGPDELAQALLLKDESNSTGLHILAWLMPQNLSRVLQIIERAEEGPDNLAEILNIQNDDQTSGLYMLAERNPNQLPQVLNIITKAKNGPNQLVQALLLKDEHDNSGLIILAEMCPKILPQVFKIIEQQSPEQIEKFLTNLIKSKALSHILNKAHPHFTNTIALFSLTPKGTELLATALLSKKELLSDIRIKSTEYLNYTLEIAAKGLKKLALNELEANYPSMNKQVSTPSLSIFSPDPEESAARKLVEALQGNSYKPLSDAETKALTEKAIATIIRKYAATNIIPNEFLSSNTTEIRRNKSL